MALSVENIPSRSRFGRDNLIVSRSAGSDIDFALQSVGPLGGLTSSREVITWTLEVTPTGWKRPRCIDAHMASIHQFRGPSFTCLLAAAFRPKSGLWLRLQPVRYTKHKAHQNQQGLSPDGEISHTIYRAFQGLLHRASGLRGADSDRDRELRAMTPLSRIPSPFCLRNCSAD
jgi:hypothetical protein